MVIYGSGELGKDEGEGRYWDPMQAEWGCGTSATVLQMLVYLVVSTLPFHKERGILNDNLQFQSHKPYGPPISVTL